MTRSILPLVAVLAIALVSACSNSSTGSGDGGGTGVVTCANTAAYPPAPYGTTEGFRIADVGARVQKGKDGTPATKKLSDYRAQCVASKTKVLAIFGAAEFCTPCRMEQPGLVGDYEDYKAANQPVEFLVLVTQKQNMSPADDATVNTWATTYSIPFDVGRDDSGAFGSYFQAAAFPQAMVIRLDDMSIQAYWQGNLPGMAKSAVDAALQ